MTRDTLPGKNQSTFLRTGVRVHPRVRTCICTIISVISVTSVIYRGKIAMTLAMTLLRKRLDVSFANGGLRHA